MLQVILKSTILIKYQEIILKNYLISKYSIRIQFNIRLKIFFSYKNINYILYFPYSQNINKEFENYYIPYPPYSEKIIEKYRHDIIEPFHNSDYKKIFIFAI